jgi:hypothetical protein
MSAQTAIGALFAVGILSTIVIANPNDQTGRPVKTASVSTPFYDPVGEALGKVELNVHSMTKDGFGNVLMLDKFSIANKGAQTVKDFRVTCTL